MTEELISGELSARLDGAVLRDIRVANRPVLDSVYVTVRDHAWRDVPAMVESSEVVAAADGFVVKLSVRHVAGDIEFWWDGAITGHAGTLVFSMDGAAMSEFAANRVGFCIEHPLSLKDTEVLLSGPSGDRTSKFPTDVSAHQVFTKLDGMRFEVSGGVEVDLGLIGGIFETEDHRNWTDPGWKTYSPPLALPVPVLWKIGEAIHQEVRVAATRVTAPGPAIPEARAADCAELVLGAVGAARAATLGTGVSGLEELAQPTIDAIRGLGASGLHVEIESGSDWPTVLDRAVAEASAAGLPLDVAMVGEHADFREMVAGVRDLAVDIRRLTCFDPFTHTTTADGQAAILPLLRGLRSASFGGGSRANFAELNRGSFDFADWGFASFAVSPQVHHTEDIAILKTAAAMPDCIASARRLFGGLPLVVGPITLRPRFRAYGPEITHLPLLDEPRDDIDERQHSELAAAYLLAAFVGMSGCVHLIAFRSFGRRGLLRPDGGATKLSAVFAELSALGGREIIGVVSSHPDLRAVAVAMDDGMRLVVVNMSARAVEVRFGDHAPPDMRLAIGTVTRSSTAIELGPGSALVGSLPGGPRDG